MNLPPGSEVFTVSLGEVEAVDNVMVADVNLPRQIVSGRERITPTARLVRRGGEAERTVDVTLELDGQEIQSSPVTRPGTSAAPWCRWMC